ncbi:hypothetical protein [Caulobacter sp. LARHSG274]
MTLDRRGLLAAGLALGLGGCAGRGGVRLVATATGPGELETLKAISADAAGLTIRVASHGCTRKADFAFYVDRTGLQPTIAFARKRLDVCPALETGEAVLAFSYAELGVSGQGRLVVLNPVGEGR